MNNALFALIIILMAVVTFILGAGLWNMMQGGSANRSQMLMRLRVIFQFLAVVAMVFALIFVGRG